MRVIKIRITAGLSVENNVDVSTLLFCHAIGAVIACIKVQFFSTF